MSPATGKGGPGNVCIIKVFILLNVKRIDVKRIVERLILVSVSLLYVFRTQHMSNYSDVVTSYCKSHNFKIL